MSSTVFYCDALAEQANEAPTGMGTKCPNCFICKALKNVQMCVCNHAGLLQQRLEDSTAAAEQGAAELREQLSAALQTAALSSAVAAAAEARADALASQVVNLRRHEAELVQHNDDLAAHLVRLAEIRSLQVVTWCTGEGSYST